MNWNRFQEKLCQTRSHRGIQLLAMALVVGVSWVSMNHASALYILTGAEDSAIVLEDGAQVEELSSTLVHLSSSAKGYDVTLTAGQSVTIRRGDTTQVVKAKNETVAALLDRAGILLSPLEMVAVDVSGENVVLTIDSELTYYDQVTEAVSYQTVRVANPDLPAGTEQVVQEGADGVRTAIYEVIWSGGEQISRHFVEEVDSTAVDEIVEYGTASETANAQSGIASVSKNADGSGTLTLASGEVLAFSGVKSMTATAYTAGHGGANNTTATGTTVHVGVVAVDKSVIPLGTRMYIVTNDGSVVYGLAVAEDTGVRGNIVDLYYDTYQQCINFGRRGCTVYILK